MPAKLHFETCRSEFAPGLPVPGREAKDFGKGQDDRRFGSEVLNNW